MWRNANTAAGMWDINKYWQMLTSDWKLDVALWNIVWVEQFDKFWTNPDVWPATTPEDIWNGWWAYTWFWTEVETMEIFSSSILDNWVTPNTGARTVTISWLLDATYAQMPNITVTLNWTTAVSLWAQPYLRANRLQIKSAWTGWKNAWNITLRHTATTTNIFAIMPIWNNQTTIMAFTVPLWKTILINRWSMHMARSGWWLWSAKCTVRHRPFWEVFHAVKDITITDSQWYYFENNWYMVFNEKEDVKATVDVVSDNGTIVSAEANWYMITN